MQTTITFSRRTTNAAKGLAVFFMLFHHLFYCSPEFVEKYGFSTFFIRPERIIELSGAAKICVAVFVFITAYGISLSMKKDEGPKDSMKSAVRRWIKLEKNFLIVFIIAIATCFLRTDRLSVYLQSGGLMAPVYFVIDALGLSSLFGTPTYNETWWYMSLAILLIFLVPVMAMIFRRISYGLVVIVFFLPYLGMQYTGATLYLFAAVLGIWMAHSSFLTRINGRFKSGGAKALLFVLLLVILAALVYIRIRIGLTYWIDALAAADICLGFHVLIDMGGLPFPVVSFVGKYSMNIFLIHTLIFEYYFTPFIYSFRNWLLITLVLLGISLAVSIGIEAIKKIRAPRSPSEA